MSARAIVLALVATSLAVAAPASFAVSSQTDAKGKVTFLTTETGNASATNGAVAGVGHFTVSGAISDKGKSTSYRADKPTKTLIRRVLVGNKGTINLLVTISKTAFTKLWTLTSGTRAYKGLHGAGTETSAVFTGNKVVVTLTGTVSQ